MRTCCVTQLTTAYRTYLIAVLATPSLRVTIGPVSLLTVAAALSTAVVTQCYCFVTLVPSFAMSRMAPGPVGSTAYCGGKCCTGECTYESSTGRYACVNPPPCAHNLDNPAISIECLMSACVFLSVLLECDLCRGVASADTPKPYPCSRVAFDPQYRAHGAAFRRHSIHANCVPCARSRGPSNRLSRP